MTTCITFTIPGPPQPKERARTVTRNGRTRTVTSKRTREYELHVAWHARVPSVRTGSWSTEGDMRVELNCYMPTRRRVDCDNLAKSLLDGMQGEIFENDSQVCELTVRRYYDKTNPRVEVMVERATT